MSTTRHALDFAADFEVQKLEARRLLDALPAEAQTWRPRPDKWSACEHLAHLPRTTRPYLAAIADALARAHAAGTFGGGQPYARGGRIGAWFVRSMEPPPRMRVRTFRKLIPAPDISVVAALDEFDASQDEAIAMLQRGAGLDLGRVAMRSPFVRLLRLSVAQAFLVILAHNRRHFWHVERISEHPQRPGRG
jgi:hypothetical protein